MEVTPQAFAPPAPSAEATWIEPMPSAPVLGPPAPESAAVPSFAPLPAAALTRATAAAPTVTLDLIANGSFDGSADGWRGSNSALELVRGLTGQAVRVKRTNSRDAFAIVAGKPVTSAKAGKGYRAGAFVRSVSPGMFVCLRVEEFAKGKARVPVTTERCSAATTGWQRLKVESRTTAKGSKLVFSVRVIAALGGTSFDVDGFRLT
jgi:hypothetical protein